MSLGYGVGDFFALDIGTDALRLVQLSGNDQHDWSLQKFAYVPIDRAIAQDSSVAGKRKLGELIASAAQQAGIKTKNIVLGIPSRKCYTSIVEIPTSDTKTMEKTIRYHEDQYVPMPLDETRVDHLILGPNPRDPKMTEVLISATAISYAEDRMESVEKYGFNLVALEPEAIAFSRALMPKERNEQQARCFVDFNEAGSDLTIVSTAPKLIRYLPGGLAELVKTASSTLGVPEDQARQFILKFGLAQDKLEGQVFRSIDPVLEVFANEILKSIRFFNSKYPETVVGEIQLVGFSGRIPFLPEYIEAKTGIRATNGDPWHRVSMDGKQKSALEQVASEFGVAIGLAERTNLR